MTIKRTPEMYEAATRAYDETSGLTTAIHAIVDTVLALIERDYVSRWGTLIMSIGPTYAEEEMMSPDFLEYAKKKAERRAEYMGATIERDNFEIVRQPSPVSQEPWIYLKWKLRRND